MNQNKNTFKRKLWIFMLVLTLVVSGLTCYSQSNVKADVTVYITATGSKYHSRACGRGNYYASTLSHAKAIGLTPCSKCAGGISYGGGSSSGGSSSTVSKPKPIKINKTSVVMVKGTSTNLKIKNATGTVVWSSSKTSVATVSSSGKVTAKKKGTASIVAKIGSQTKKCTVKVEEPKLTAKKVTMKVGETKKIKLKGCSHNIKWSSSDSYVVKVKKGKLIARDTGTARITAKVHGKRFVCKVKVKKPDVKTITMDNRNLTLSKDSVFTEYITCNIKPASVLDYYDVDCYSENENVVTVDWFGDGIIEVCPEGIGETNIIVKVGGKQMDCHVVVQ